MRTNAPVAAATGAGFRRASGELVAGGVFVLKDAVEWEYCQSVEYLRGQDPFAL